MKSGEMCFHGVLKKVRYLTCVAGGERGKPMLIRESSAVIQILDKKNYVDKYFIYMSILNKIISTYLGLEFY